MKRQWSHEMGFALAFTASSTCCSNLQSQSLLFAAAALRSKPCLSLCNTYRPKRIRKRSPIVGAQSENGALVTSEKPDTNYGRQYFPLAAVVGQVIINLSASFLQILYIFVFLACVKCVYCYLRQCGIAF